MAVMTRAAENNDDRIPTPLSFSSLYYNMYCASESVSWRTEVNGHSERRRNHGNMDGKDDKSSRNKRLSNADSIPLIQFDMIYIMYILQRWVLWRSEEVGHLATLREFVSKERWTIKVFFSPLLLSSLPFIFP